MHILVNNLTNSQSQKIKKWTLAILDQQRL